MQPSEVPHFLPCLISPKVALTEIAVIGLIVAILTWKPQMSLTVGILLAVVVLIGVAAIASQVKDLLRLRMARHVLPLRLEEGQALFERKGEMTGRTEEELLSWNNLTEENLREYVDELHVARFRFAGYADRRSSFTTYHLKAKLHFLDDLLKELKD